MTQKKESLYLVNQTLTMSRTLTLVVAVVYLLLWLGLLINFGLPFLQKSNSNPVDILYQCVIIGGIGGVFYCLRGVYVSHSVKKIWSNDWLVWYFVRPIVSCICGGVSFLFLKAGLLVLEAKKEADASNLGFLA